MFRVWKKELKVARSREPGKKTVLGPCCLGSLQFFSRQANSQHLLTRLKSVSLVIKLHHSDGQGIVADLKGVAEGLALFVGGRDGKRVNEMVCHG